MAVSQLKTPLALFRRSLGQAGGETNFSKLTGLSTSYIKKISCGHLALSRKAALKIQETTGASYYFLLGKSEEMHASKSLSMKSILEFELPQDSAEMRYAQAGLDALLVLNDLDQECRSRLKHGAGAFADLDESTIERIREWVRGESVRRNLPELE